MRKAEKLIIAIKVLEKFKWGECEYVEALEYAIKELKKILATCPINEQRNMCDEAP